MRFRLNFGILESWNLELQRFALAISGSFGNSIELLDFLGKKLKKSKFQIPGFQDYAISFEFWNLGILESWNPEILELKK